MGGAFFRSFLILLGASALVNSTPIRAKDKGISVQELREQTREDIEAGYQLFATHHPGMYNPLDPNFGERLKAARDEALTRASTVTNAADRYLAVGVINQALSDGHARMGIAFNGSMGKHPGFRGAWRGDGLYITHSDHETPSRGDKLLSCDGEAARDLIERIAFYSNGNPKEAGQWWVRARSVFRNGDLTPKPALKSCRFETTDGHIATVDLDWQPYERDAFIALIEAAQPEPVGMERLDNGLRWITLSSFNPGKKGIDAYDGIFAELEADREALQSDRAIVLDLRGNKGGSSSWSRKIAQRLWGKQAVDWAMAEYFRETQVWYLADQANIDHFKNGARRFKRKGIKDVAATLETIHQNLTAAQASGETFFKSTFGKDLFEKTKPARPNAVPPVYVITDGACVSACLDAVDIFTRFEGVKLVGAPTSADTEYLEIRRERLPSKRGWVVLPTKIWVKRPRGSGEIYRPDILITDLDWDSAAMTRAILNDLKGQAEALAVRDQEQRAAP